MVNKRTLLLLLVCSVFMFACEYIVVPEEDAVGFTYGVNKGWSGVATRIGKNDAGDLRIELTIQNQTGDWSKMWAGDSPAVLAGSGGQKTDCETVFMGTGGHRLAPGFRMRGYIAGKKAEPQEQLIYVECKGAEAAAGSKLTIGYSYVTGQYNYYEQEKNLADGAMEIDLDRVVSDLSYPVAEQLEGLLQDASMEILALNKVVLKLEKTERTETGLIFSWKTINPGEYPTYVHIGNPPVIGSDGILYGFYETPDIVSAPITPGKGETEWTTEVIVPSGAHGLYILLSVESGKQRLFANYALDISTE